jgi:hypothetical protein
MKKLLLLSIFTVFLLNSCISTNTVHTVNDDYKNEKIIYLTQKIISKSLEEKLFSRNIKVVTLTWKKVSTKQDSSLFFELALANNSTLDHDFFIKTDSNLYEITFKDLKSTVKQGSNEEESIETKSDSTIIKKHAVSYYNYQQIKAKTTLKNTILKDIANSSELNIRYYIDETPYSVKFNQFELKKLKKYITLN